MTNEKIVFEVGKKYQTQGGDRVEYVGECGVRCYFKDTDKNGYFVTANPDFAGCVDFYTSYAQGSFNLASQD
jgi:hypothetical protein